MTETLTGRAGNGIQSAAKAWSRALEMTARIGHDRGRVLPTVIEEVAARSRR